MHDPDFDATLLEELRRERDAIEIPSDALRGVRHRVAARVRRRRLATRGSAFALQACAFLAIGFFVGMWRRPPSRQPGEEIVAGLSRAAASSREVPKYVLSDVRLVGVNDGVVEISAIAGQEVRLRLRREDPLVARQVVEAWLAGGSTDQRLQAAQLAEPRRDRRVRDALLTAVAHDPSQAVQLAALSRVASLPPDTAIVSALREVAAKDDDVAVKLRAIDYLTSHEEK